MLITAIIPTYNRVAHLERAIVSVVAQTQPCNELIVVDDGSTDGTVAIVEQLAASANIPIRLLRQENRGAAAARNSGIRMAKGRLLAFLDSDDWWLPHKLALQTAAMRAHPRSNGMGKRDNIVRRQVAKLDSRLPESVAATTARNNQCHGRRSDCWR